MYSKTQNKDNLDAQMIALTGAYFIFVPEKISPFYRSTVGEQGINMGHVLNPAETYTPTTVKVDTGVFGRLRTAREFTTKTEETGTFETRSSANLTIRSLWSGGQFTEDASVTAAAFQATHAYALGTFVTPTTSNGHYYEVTTAGTSSGTEPTSWKTDGGTNASGTVTFTDRGVLPVPKLAVIARNHTTYTGMLIEVSVPVEDTDDLEIYVAPNAQLRGDGFGAGRNSTDATSLKFAYTVLSPPQGYTVPAEISTAFENVRVSGGYDILNVPADQEERIIDALIAGYYA